MTHSSRTLLSFALVLTLGTVAAAKNSFYASTERFGYTGTVSVFDTLEDAKHNRHPRGSYLVVPQRDGSLYVVRNAPTFDIDSAEFLTNWYDDAAHDNGGTANPNNTDFGFIQMADGLFGAPTTWKTHVGYWHHDLNTFSVHVTGENATYPATYARFWNAGYPDVGGEGTTGTFINYDFKLNAYGLHPVNQGNHFFASTNNASMYSGTFKGIFQNLSTTSPQSNGFYSIKLWFNTTSWAASNGYAGNDAFGSNSVRRDGDDNRDDDGGRNGDGDD